MEQNYELRPTLMLQKFFSTSLSGWSLPKQNYFTRRFMNRMFLATLLSEKHLYFVAGKQI